MPRYWFVVMSVIPIIGMIYCIYKKRPSNIFALWVGAFLFLVGFAFSSPLNSIAIICGIALLLVAGCNPFGIFGKITNSDNRTNIRNNENTKNEPDSAPYSATTRPSISQNIYNTNTESTTNTSQYSTETRPLVSSISSETQSIGMKNVSTTANLPIPLLYVRFFSAVNLFKEPSGRGSIALSKGANGNEVKIVGDYCNYECRDCSSRISNFLGSGYGFRMLGENDHFWFEIVNMQCLPSDFGASLMVQELKKIIPTATITGKHERDDFCSIQFST